MILIRDKDLTFILDRPHTIGQTIGSGLVLELQHILKALEKEMYIFFTSS